MLLVSCGNSKEDAKEHLKILRFEILRPVDVSVAEQNYEINEFLSKMKRGEEVDVVSEVASIEKSRVESMRLIDKAIEKTANVPEFDEEIGLQIQTIQYLHEIKSFELYLEAGLEGLKDGFDPIGMMNLSKELAKGERMEKSKLIYERALSNFKNEYGITILDEMQMQSGSR